MREENDIVPLCGTRSCPSLPSRAGRRTLRREVTRWLLIALLTGLGRLQAASASALAPELWTSAQQSADIHRFSTLFTVQCVHSYLSSDDDIAEAIRWCQEIGRAHV